MVDDAIQLIDVGLWICLLNDMQLVLQPTISFYSLPTRRNKLSNLVTDSYQPHHFIEQKCLNIDVRIDLTSFLK